MSKAKTGLERYDPLDDQWLQDPYPEYHRMRGEAPVHLGEPPFPSVKRCHYAFRHSDVCSILADRRLGRLRPGQADQRPSEPGWLRRIGRSMVLFNDPPDHTRMRRLLNAAFSPEFVRKLRPRVDALSNRLLASLPRDEPFDLMNGFARPFPILVIAGAMGLPDEDSEQIREWSRSLIEATDPRGSGAPVGRAGRAAVELMRYLQDLLPERRQHPGDDLLSRLLLVQQEGSRLSEDEVLANAMLLLSAGHETTTGLLGNGFLALLQNPSEWRRLRNAPELIPSAIEELLRYDSPVQMTFRFAREPILLGGSRIETGDAVGAVLGSANRDPAVFSDPDRVDIGRSPNPHLAFSLGSHFCMGPELARMEAGAALEAVLRGWPDLELAGTPVRSGTVSFRSLVSLPVASSGHS